ncbi:MAG: hypothetical protein N3B13_05725 [Deltaproteobacteria bacterium]|nr:hypothetical protein [Deltaproteobacteria bacterium]
MRKLHYDIFGCDIEEFIPANSTLRSNIENFSLRRKTAYEIRCRAVFYKEYSYHIYSSDWCIKPIQRYEMMEYEYDYLNIYLFKKKIRFKPFCAYADRDIRFIHLDDLERLYPAVLERLQKEISRDKINSAFEKAEALSRKAVDFWGDIFPVNYSTKYTVELREQRKKWARYSPLLIDNVNLSENIKYIHYDTYPVISTFGISSCGVDEDNNYFILIMINRSWNGAPQFLKRVADFRNSSLDLQENVHHDITTCKLQVKNREERNKLWAILIDAWL